MVSSRTAVAITVLIMRFLVLILLLVSLMVLVTDKMIFSDGDGNKTTFVFKKNYAYRYLLSVAVIGCGGMLLQILFAALSICKRNNSTLISQLVIYADLVLALLFATGVGAGFGIPVDLKTYQDDPHTKDIDRFLDLVHVSTGFLLIATIFTAVTITIKIHAVAMKSFL